MLREILFHRMYAIKMCFTFQHHLSVAPVLPDKRKNTHFAYFHLNAALSGIVCQ